MTKEEKEIVNERAAKWLGWTRDGTDWYAPVAAYGRQKYESAIKFEMLFDIFNDARDASELMEAMRDRGTKISIESLLYTDKHYHVIGSNEDRGINTGDSFGQWQEGVATIWDRVYGKDLVDQDLSYTEE